jgi:hypothetical protein
LHYCLFWPAGGDASDGPTILICNITTFRIRLVKAAGVAGAIAADTAGPVAFSGMRIEK